MKSKSCIVVSNILVLFGTISANAQSSDACVGLLRHGIYDTIRQTNTSASATQIQQQMCTAYEQYKQDKSGGNVKASYSVFSASASFSKDQIESIGSSMCEANFSHSQADASLSNFSSAISSSGIDAYRDCIKTTNQGLQSITTFDEDGGSGFSLTLYYIQSVGSPVTDIKFAGILKNDDAAIRCTGNLSAMAPDASIKQSFAYQLDCRRPILEKPTQYQGRLVWSLPAVVTVSTSAGSIVRSLSALPAGPPPTILTMPIGSIVAFSGTMDSALAEQERGWWVADGRTVTDPVAATFFQKKTPDLRDRFLLGSTSSGETGGGLKAKIPEQVIDSHTTGGFGEPTFHGDPFTHMQGSHSWTTERSIYSQGLFKSTEIDLPSQPYYKVLYLIRVK